MRIIRHYACVVESPPPHASFPTRVCWSVCVGMHVIVLTISIHKSVCGMQIYCILCRQAAAFSFWRCRCCSCSGSCCCSSSVWSILLFCSALVWFSLSFLHFSLFVSFCFGLVLVLLAAKASFWLGFAFAIDMCVGGGMGGVSLKMFVGIGIWVPRFPPLTVLTVHAYIVWVRVSACLSLALHLLCLHNEVAGDYIYIAVKSVRDSEIMQCLTEQAKWENI